MDRDSTSRPVAIVASDRAGRRSALRAHLESSGLAVLETTSVLELRAAVRDGDHLRVAFIDVGLADEEPLSISDVVRMVHTRVAVWVVTDDDGEDEAIRAVEAGARGLVFSRHIDTALVSSIVAGVLAEHRLEHSIQVAESAVLESEHRYRALFGLARDPMLIADVEGTIIEANEPARDVLAASDEGLIGRSLFDLVPGDSDRDRIRAAFSPDADDADLILRVRGLEGADEDRWFTMVARPRRDVFGQPHGLFCSLAPPKDIGLGSSFALLYVEVAGIDVLDAPEGRPTGEDIAAALTNRIADTLREGDIVTRVGLDEFVVLLGEIEERKMGSIVADRLRTRLSEPLLIGDRRVRLECSIGGRNPSSPTAPAGAGFTGSTDSGIVLLELPRRREGGTIVGGPAGASGFDPDSMRN